MAANSRELILTFLISLILALYSQAQVSTTTPNNETTTVKATTPTATSTTPASTTTQLVPTATPSPIPENTDVGQCTCDLTGNACDVNCCCDPDCTSEDKTAFSQCIDQNANSPSQACVQSKIMFTNNSPYRVDTTVPGLFCVIIDNYNQRNYYTVPDPVNTTEKFNVYREKYSGPSYQPESSPGVINIDSLTDYKSGDPVLTVFESNVLGVLGLPRPLTTTDCHDSNPAAYLAEQSSECTRPVTDLAQQCETELSLRAETYYSRFKVASTPIIFKYQTVNETDSTTSPIVTVATTTPSVPSSTTANVTDGITVDDNSTVFTTQSTVAITTAGAPVTEAPGLYNSSALIPVIPLNMTCVNSLQIARPCNFTATDIPRPTYDRSTQICSNVVSGVKYLITHNSSGRISQVNVNFVLSSITQNSLPLTQKFESTYKSEFESGAFPRSGNPGYVIGQPVMSGKLIQETNGQVVGQAIQVSSDRDQWMTIVTSSPLGECKTEPNNRASIKFGENMRSGCNIKLSYRNFTQDCQWIQDAINNALLGGEDLTNKYVARFGNTAPESVGDWVPVLRENVPGGSTPSETEQGVCLNVAMGLHIEIVYANVGSLSNPQAKVIGVTYRYDTPQVLQYLCTGRYCQPGMEDLAQNFEVVSSVAFIDASSPAAPALAERPQVTAKLPADFFHPFYPSASPRISYSYQQVALAALISVFSVTSQWMNS